MKRVYIALLLVSTLFIGCARIPKESLQLCDTMEKGMQDQNRAYLNLLDAYFVQKSKDIDVFIADVYTPGVFSRIRSKMASEGEKEIPDSASQQIVQSIICRRDSMQAVLEKIRLKIWEDVLANQMILNDANSAIKALLASAIKSREATETALKAADTVTGNKFNFAEFDKKFDQYMVNIGSGTAKMNDLYESTTQIISGGK
jgi:hypothetical protein